AVDAEQRVVLVSQYREPARKELVELPAGTREEDEDALATAKRELEEECALVGGEWRRLAGVWATPGFVREDMHLYLATGVEEGGTHDCEEARPSASSAGRSPRSPTGSTRSRTRRRSRGSCSFSATAGRTRAERRRYCPARCADRRRQGDQDLRVPRRADP